MGYMLVIYMIQLTYLMEFGLESYEVNKNKVNNLSYWREN